ncbi:MAG: DEAD/DEAH box helicase [Lentisphaerae bacterium]|nr:MAG: DEAD/DEAH box helicase [Lentisphaerota bacterium]
MESRFDTDRESLRAILGTVMLRRLKKEVARELPERIEEMILIEMDEEEMRLYDEVYHEARAALQRGNRLEIFRLLTRLRQCCCHPGLIDPEYTKLSSKLRHALEMIGELIANGHSVLFFSQFTRVLDLVEEQLRHRRIPYAKITGAVPGRERGQRVKAFQKRDRAEVFLLSLKAAGTGLTLTKADYVILFDPWWNPAVENQAIDRTHRIGQDKTVVAYRLVACHTVEENVIRLQEQKRELFDGLVNAAGEEEQMGMELIAELLGSSFTTSR